MHTLHAIDELAQEQLAFLANYDIQRVIVANQKNDKVKLKAKQDRVCRFCNKAYPEITFENIAHLIPKSWGNTNLKSDFECDTCNNKFSLFETDFGSFLGIYRAFNAINDRKIKFKSNTIVAKEITLSTGKKVTWIINQNQQQRSFSLDLETGQGKATFFKPTYTPLNIYKLLLKIGLSCLPETEAKLYPHLLAGLNGDHDHLLVPFAEKVSIYELNLQVASPRVFVFKKKDARYKNVTHHIQIYFREFIYMFPLPLFIPDLQNGLYKDGTLDINFCPPLLLDPPGEFIQYHRDFIGLSSTNKERQEEELNFGSEPENFTKLGAWDQVTGFKPNHNMKDIQIEGIIMIDGGVSLSEAEMAELQNIFKEIRPNTPPQDKLPPE